MTTEYPTKEDAIREGFRCFDVDFNPSLVPKPEEFMGGNIGGAKPLSKYTIKNKKGKDVSFAIGKLWDGFDLWLIVDPDSGMMIRT